MSHEEHEDLLKQWNTNSILYPRNKCIHQVFEAEVLRNPDAVAVIYEDETVTYAQLNQQANRLAHYLESISVGSETLVGICIQRSLLMIVGVIAILKVGGTYVPLDPNYPQKRLKFMFEDTRLTILLTQRHFKKAFSDFRGVTTIDLDEQQEFIMQQKKSNLQSNITSENLAYVMYTSRSTGKPKGVCITHRNVVSLVKGINCIEISREDVFLQFAPVSFDASTFEIWGSLLNGARLVVFPSYTPSLEDLGSALDHYHITTLWLTAGLFHQMIESQLDKMKRVKQILAGGDILSVTHVKKATTAGCRIINGYGPTECTTFACCYRVISEDFRSSIPIGRPISNTQVYILDADLQPVPIGMTGELYIGGDGLARGYFDRPELTMERFVPNPFSSELSLRLYKTGDMVKYRADGNLEFLGRLDNQVKIRGFRIELGEVEAAINKHMAVRECVIIVCDNIFGEKQLIAYVVMREGKECSMTELRTYLRKHLPEYMVPFAFVVLDILPLTPNGKVDREALPKPNRVRPDSEFEYVAPRNEIEKILVRLWKEVLGIDQIGIHDNFFDLGGDSLRFMQVHSKCSRTGLLFTNNQFMQAKTIADLANLTIKPVTICAEQGLITGLVPLTPMQLGALERVKLEDSLVATMGYFFDVGSLDPLYAQEATHQIILHHDALRLRFVHDETGWHQFCEETDESSTFYKFDLSLLDIPEQAIVMAAKANELRRNMNHITGPFICVAFFGLGLNKPSRLLVIFHHMVVDQVSINILIEDLEIVCIQLSRGQAINLPRKTTSLKYWSERLEEYAQSPTVMDDLNYWLPLAKKSFPRLPVDYPKGNGPRESASLYRYPQVKVSLPSNEVKSLTQRVLLVLHVQIIDVLLTALNHAFAQWTGFSQLPIRLPTHGRNTPFEDIDLSRTVGWINNSVPIILDFGEASLGKEALSIIKQQIYQANIRSTSYMALRYMQKESDIKDMLRRFGRTPEVSFNFVGWSDQFRPESSLFVPVHESIELYSHIPRTTSIRIWGTIEKDGTMEFSWIFNDAYYNRSTIEYISRIYMDTIIFLIHKMR